MYTHVCRKTSTMADQGLKNGPVPLFWKWCLINKPVSNIISERPIYSCCCWSDVDPVELWLTLEPGQLTRGQISDRLKCSDVIVTTSIGINNIPGASLIAG